MARSPTRSPVPTPRLARDGRAQGATAHACETHTLWQCSRSHSPLSPPQGGPGNGSLLSLSVGPGSASHHRVSGASCEGGYWDGLARDGRPAPADVWPPFSKVSATGHGWKSTGKSLPRLPRRRWRSIGRRAVPTLDSRTHPVCA
jgi:hypothetical protein